MNTIKETYKKNYFVSTNGDVYHKVNGELKELKQATNNGGYKYVTVESGKYTFVAPLVFETFYGKIPEGYTINHIDSDKSNNSLKNLQICTHQENCLLKEPNLIPSFNVTDNGKYHLRFSMMGELICGTYDNIDAMLKDFEVLRNTKIKLQKKLIKKINKNMKEMYS